MSTLQDMRESLLQISLLSIVNCLHMIMQNMIYDPNFSKIYYVIIIVPIIINGARKRSGICFNIIILMLKCIIIADLCALYSVFANDLCFK